MPDSQFSKPTPAANDQVGSLVNEFLEEKQKERVEEKARQLRRKSNPFVIGLLILICLTVWVAPSFVPQAEPPLTKETLEQGARLTLYLASLRVRNYVVTHKQLPTDLNQVGVDTVGIVYRRGSNSAFELSTQVQGTPLVYRSTIPDSVFLGPDLRIKGIS